MEKIKSIEHFLSMANKELDEIFKNGQVVEWKNLDGNSFNGVNHLGITKLLTINKFQKLFYTCNNSKRGFNVRIKSDKNYFKHEPILKKNVPFAHGFFEIITESNCCKLDYSLGGNPFYDPSCLLKDELVHVNDFILGKALVLNRFLTYFILQKSLPFYLREKRQPNQASNFFEFDVHFGNILVGFISFTKSSSDIHIIRIEKNEDKILLTHFLEKLYTQLINDNDMKIDRIISGNLNTNNEPIWDRFMLKNHKVKKITLPNTGTHYALYK